MKKSRFSVELIVSMIQQAELGLPVWSVMLVFTSRHFQL